MSEPNLVNPRRVRPLNTAEPKAGPVVYWMHRDLRAKDNWGLLHARDVAARTGAPLAVVFALAPSFLGATLRQYGFLLRGLEGTANHLAELRIPFFLRLGNPPEEVLAFCKEHGAGALVTDFDVLRLKRQWMTQVANEVGVAAMEADSRNVVPCWVASDKQEYAARTIRPKIHRLLPEFLTEIPELAPPEVPWPGDLPNPDFGAARDSLRVDTAVPEVDWLTPGEGGAADMLETFVEAKLTGYDTERNDPTKDALSNMSPYLHFGHISAQRVALTVAASRKKKDSREAFLEELVVRRELSDNFCYYNQDYDTSKCFPEWAQKTLEEHQTDEREHVYTAQELEEAQTHDPLWNAAQLEMVHRGKMHGYMRMYWAKKILEWSDTPASAQKAAIDLNDKYELDGRDSNGYVGVAWSIGGVHDRAWPSRPVFGKVRFMSFGGAKSKFNVQAYIRAHTPQS